MHENIAVVGAPKNRFDASGQNEVSRSGAVFVYEINGSGEWSQTQKIVAPDREATIDFGESVSVHGNFMIISASFAAVTTVAYIFEKGNSGLWKFKQELVPASKSHQVRGAVSIYENYAIVGSFGEYLDENDNQTSHAGAAYIYERDEFGVWNQRQRIVPDERFVGEFFGESVDIHMNQVIVGAENNLGVSEEHASGAAYIFESDESGVWQQVQQLKASDRTQRHIFGSSVSIYENSAVVGAYGVDKAFVFNRDNVGKWTENQILFTNNKLPSDFLKFGGDVDIYDGYIVVGAERTKIGANENVGSAYLFSQDENNVWKEDKKFVPSDGEFQDFFGTAVAAYDSKVIVGSILNDKIGSAYIFEPKPIATSIEINNLSNKIKVFPNPTSGHFFIKLKDIYSKNVEISIMDITGKSVLNEIYVMESFDLHFSLSDLPSGVYNIIINTGRKTLLKKVIKN